MMYFINFFYNCLDIAVWICIYTWRYKAKPMIKISFLNWYCTVSNTYSQMAKFKQKRAWTKFQDGNLNAEKTGQTLKEPLILGPPFSAFKIFPCCSPSPLLKFYHLWIVFILFLKQSVSAYCIIQPILSRPTSPVNLLRLTRGMTRRFGLATPKGQQQSKY